MTLAEFRRLTAHLSGDLEFYCAGADIGLLWHRDDYLSIDDDASYPLEGDFTVLFRASEIGVC